MKHEKWFRVEPKGSKEVYAFAHIYDYYEWLYHELVSNRMRLTTREMDAVTFNARGYKHRPIM